MTPVPHARAAPVLVTRSQLPTLDEFVAQIGELWESHWLTNQGALHERFRERLCAYLGHGGGLTLFVNGHLALDAGIKALGLTGEVITTPFSFVSTTHAVTMNGLTPVFCDIRPDDFTIDPEQLERLITPRTSAVLAVHVYGRPCQLAALQEICTRRRLRLIYDAAHAFGVRTDGRSIAEFGDLTMFSFHATKVFHSIEGGALAYRDERFSPALDRLKNFGIAGAEDVPGIGYNAKMNEFQAAMGLCNLTSLDEAISKRARCDRLYRDLLAGAPGIILGAEPAAGLRHNYAYMPILVDESRAGRTRDQLVADLCRQGIVARKYFYPLIPDLACYRGQYGGCALPVARAVAERVMTVPLYADLPLETVARIAQAIRGEDQAATPRAAMSWPGSRPPPHAPARGERSATEPAATLVRGATRVARRRTAALGTTDA